MPEGIYNGFASIAILGSFRSGADSQPARLDADLNLVWTKSGHLCVRDKMVVRFPDVAFHGLQQLGFREKPILPVVSVRVSAAFENLKRALGNQVEYALCMFEKFMRGYEIQISAVFFRWCN